MNTIRSRKRTLMLVLALWGAAAFAQPAAPAVALAPDAAPAPMRELTLLELLQRGGLVMYPLYLCSLVLVAFGIERAISLRRRNLIPADVEAKIFAATMDTQSAETRRQLLAEIQAHDSAIGRIVKAGFRKPNAPLLELEKAVEDAGAKEVAKLQRPNRVLSSVASVSPLLGLLGTVTGIIRAFMTVAASPEALGKTEVLAAGIYEALVTTAVGIAVAIPAMVLYFYFQDRVEALVGHIDEIATELVDKLAGKV